MESSRRALLAVRDAIPSEQRSCFSKSICRAIMDSSHYKAARDIMCYAAIGSEVSLEELISAALRDGKRVLLPVCDRDSRTMTAHYFNGELKKGAYGIDEPTGDEGVPELIICPMLAFNKARYRIGYGAGYYDKYLSSLIKNKINAVFLGAAFSVQRADFTPKAHDVPLDGIYTQEEIF